MQPNLLPEMSLSEVEKVVASANTGGDKLTPATMYATGWNAFAAANNPMRL